MADAAYAEDFEDIEGQEPANDSDDRWESLPADQRLSFLVQSTNLAMEVDDSELASIGRKVVEEYEIDLASRKDAKWEERYDAAMALALQAKEDKNYPWPGASNVKYPLIITAAIQFAARAYPAIVDGWNVVKGKALGEPTEEKQDRAERIGKHMTYQLLEEMDGWEEDTDKLLHMLPIVGNAFRKTYFDPVRGYNCSHLVSPKDFVVNYRARDLESAPRATHVCRYYPNEIEERVRSGLWRRVELGPQPENDELAPHEFLEQHRLLDLDEDGYAEPYIVTVHKETMGVVRIVARFDPEGVKLAADPDTGEAIVESIKPVRYFTKYSFIPSPDGAFYDIGFGTLLEALNETINSTLNQLMDAGHLQNTGGGFIGKGPKMKSGALRFAPGEWKPVEATGADVRASIVPLPQITPSTVLFQLLGMLVEAAKDITATKDILTGDQGQNSNTPVGTTLALIEQGLKVFTAIYKRIHRGLRQELECLYRLNRLYLDDQVYFNLMDTPGAVARQDYEDQSIDVIPVSDPTVVSDMQRLGRAQFLMQFAADPTLNHKEILERVLSAANIPDIEQLWAPPPAPDPKTMKLMADVEHERKSLEIEEAKTRSEIAVNEADAQMKAIQAALAAPAFMAQVAQFIDERVQERLTQAQAGNADGGQPQGMGGPPPDAGMAQVPEGPANGPGPAMGAGDVPGALGAGPGGPAGATLGT